VVVIGKNLIDFQKIDDREHYIYAAHKLCFFAKYLKLLFITVLLQSPELLVVEK